MRRFVAIALLLAAAGVRSAPRMDLLAGTWRDDLTDLAGIEENRQGALMSPAGFSIDPGIQSYTNPYNTTGFDEQFSAPGAIAGDTLQFENPGGTTESLTLWHAQYQPHDQFQYAYDCIYNLAKAQGDDCPPDVFQNGDWSFKTLVNVPYEGTSILKAVGWDTTWGLGTWGGEFIAALNCQEPTGVLADANPTTAAIAGFYGQPLVHGLTIDQMVPGREYTATFLAGLLRGMNHLSHTSTPYLLFEFENLDLPQSYGSTTLFEGEFLDGTLPTTSKGVATANPLDFGQLTPVAVGLGAGENAAKATWDLRAYSLVPPGGHNHCTVLGPIWLNADRATYVSPVFDSGSNFTRWVDLCWSVDMSTMFRDSSASPIPDGSPITPVRLSYGVSSTKSPVLPVSWTVSHGGEGLAGVIGRNMIAANGIEACNLMQGPGGAPLVGRYFQWSATLYSRQIAQEVDPDLEPSPRPLFFGGYRPTIRRITAHYYVCSAFATSRKVLPPGVARWKTLDWIVEKPSAGGVARVDVLSGNDGSVLIADAPPGASLAGINPLVHSSLVLRATLESDPADCNLRPVLRTWQVSWEPLIDVILVSCNAIRPALGEICRMQLRVDRPGRAVVEVHDAAGQLVVSLLDGEVGTGAQLMAWNGHGSAGEIVAPGVYFVHARVPGGRRVVRVAVLR